MIAVEAHGLTRWFGARLAVDHLDLAVRAGSVVGLVGRNGAGKTTTMSMVLGLLAPSEGSVQVLGLDPVTRGHDLHRRVGYLPHRVGVRRGLTVGEDLALHAAARGLTPTAGSRRVDDLLPVLGLEGAAALACQSLSHGRRQRLGLARAMIHDPALLVLDEPTNGLDPRARVQLRRLLRALADQGRTVLVSSHLLGELEQVCDRVLILEGGRLVADGSPSQVTARLGGTRTIRVRLANGAERTVTVADEAAQAALVRRLMDEGFPVVEVARIGGGLEDVFLAVTDEDTEDGGPVPEAGPAGRPSASRSAAARRRRRRGSGR